MIGVAGDEHTDGLDVAPRPEVFESYTQNVSNYLRLVVRTSRDDATLTASMRSLLRTLDPTLALTDVTSMDALRGESLARTRFMTVLMLVFGVIGLVLAVVGVYGVLAQISRNRTREMGLRMALGAQPAQVRWLVVRHGLRLTVAGLLLGGLVSVYATRAMTRLLFGVAPNDPATLIGVAALLAATSLAAAWLPALWASRADPMAALRSD